MPPILASIICLMLIIILLNIERKHNPTASAALWIPTIYMLINGSRPIGRWFVTIYSEGGIEEGSPLDRFAIGLIILLAIYIIFKRRESWSINLFLKNNTVLIWLYLFLGFSILWSDFPFLSFKRWVRLLGAIPIALVVVNERSPSEALGSIFRRCAYILIPLSLLLIKYYPFLGTGYGRYTGLPFWRGATLTKNALGQLCAISCFFLLWEFIRKRHDKGSYKGDIMIADGLIVAISCHLILGISGAYSSTSIVVLILGLASVVVFYRAKEKARTLGKLLFWSSVSIWIVMVFAESIIPAITEILGRDESFTGRNAMWEMALNAAARNPIFGAGFGGYWGTPGNEFAEAFRGSVLAHNGLLDIYVEGGIIGAVLVVLFHIRLYQRFRNALSFSFDWSVFGLCFIAMTVLMNFTESLFLKTSSYVWNITIFLSVLLPYISLKDNKEDTH